MDAFYSLNTILVTANCTNQYEVSPHDSNSPQILPLGLMCLKIFPWLLFTKPVLWFVPILHPTHGQNCLFTTRKESALKNSSHLIKRLFTDYLHKPFKPKYNEGEGCLLRLQQHQSLVVSPHHLCFPSKAAHTAPAPRARHFLENILPPTAPNFQSKLSP